MVISMTHLQIPYQFCVHLDWNLNFQKRYYKKRCMCRRSFQRKFWKKSQGMMQEEWMDRISRAIADGICAFSGMEAAQ